MSSVSSEPADEDDQIGAQAFHSDFRGRLVVDSQRVVRAVNRAGEQMLLRRRGVFVRHGVLVAADVRDEAVIAHALASLAAGEVRRFVLRADGGELVKALATTMAQGDGFLIELEPVSPPGENVLPALAHVYGLTRAESQVLELLALGLSPDQAAQRLGIAEGTSRTHTKHLHAKLNVSSRGELMALLMSLK